MSHADAGRPVPGSEITGEPRPTTPGGAWGVPSPGTDDIRELRRLWLWVLLLGLAMTVLGMVALGHIFLATELSVLVYGYLMLIGGAMQIGYAVWACRWSGFFLYLLEGALFLFIGAVLVRHPLLGAAVLTFFLAIFFLIEGTMRVVAALVWPFPNRFWQFLTGFITVALGVLIWRGWPDDTVWTIGLFVGIDLLFNGWSLLLLGFIARRSLAQPV
jgi:uncharacterized membrane protein HdeD (DUF308 family)